MIRVLKGDITKLRDVDCIVNAANGIGVMGAGVAGAIARSAGEEFANNVRTFAKENGPFEAGSSYVTESGLLNRLGIKRVIHAVTMKYPGTPSRIEDIQSATREACKAAIAEGMTSIAFPGLGTGIGGLNKTQVANRMIKAMNPYMSQIQITIVDRNEDFLLDIKNALGLSEKEEEEEEEEVNGIETKQSDIGFE